jgi:hypothetical protein
MCRSERWSVAPIGNAVKRRKRVDHTAQFVPEDRFLLEILLHAERPHRTER